MATQEQTPAFLSVSEAAIRLGVSAPTVRKWVHDGHLKAVRPGGELASLRIPAFEIDRLERGA